MIKEEPNKAENEHKRMHQMGLRGIFYVYNWERLWKSKPFLISLVLSLIAVISIIVFFSPLAFNCVQTIVDLNISVFPCLLGFTIGGYALIVGFAGVGDLKQFTEKASKENGSFFQLLISIFSVSIFLQFVTILISYVITFIIKSKFHFYLFGNTQKDIFTILNCFGLFIILFISLWALFTLPLVVVNLFNFAQTNHSIAYSEREEDEKSGTDSEYQIRLLEEIVKTLKENINSEHSN